jgi:hypothetical protein
MAIMRRLDPSAAAAAMGRSARARPSGRAQLAGSARRAGESGDELNHVRVAAGGALDPIEANSATQRDANVCGPG